MDAAERWLFAKGEQPSDMLRFAAYLRELRYLSEHNIEALANELQLPYEQIALLERGLLKPSEVPGPTWIRLMRLLEGREGLRN
jgi:hypothetical protein